MSEDIFDLRPYMSAELCREFNEFQPAALILWNNASLEKTKFGLDQSTARAIGTGLTGKHGPIALFNAWAQDELAHASEPASLAPLATVIGFQTWHTRLCDSLKSYWHRAVSENNNFREKNLPDGTQFVPKDPVLQFAHCRKMVDLFIRALRVRQDAPQELRETCLRFGNIPLDRKSIAVLQAAYGLVSVGHAFSMGDIRTSESYQTYQNLARAICKQTWGSPLMLDVFAWHSPYAKALYA